MSYTNKHHINKNHFLTAKQTFSVCLFVLSILFASLLVNTNTFATSININLSNSTISVDASILNAIGSFYSSDDSTISVTTDNETGYTLSILGNNGTNLTDGSYNLSSIESPVSESSFSDIYNTVYNNKWGYKPSKLNSEDNTNYLPSPTAAGDIIDKTWVANSTANTYTLSIGTRVNSTTPPGSYSNTFVITAVANGPLLTVNYDGNGLYFDNDSTVTTNTVAYNAISSSSGGTTTYSKTAMRGEYKTPGRTNGGYTFSGWSEDPYATTATYTNEAQISQNLPYVNGDPAVTLYAVWDLTNPNYTVRYDGNGADTNVGVMSGVYHTNVNPGDTFDLFASNFKRDGYGFAGWNTKADGTGTSYGPNQMVTVDANFQAYKDKVNQEITLYANWIPLAKDILDNDLTFQTTNLLSVTLSDGTTLASKSNGYVTALKDARDNQVYAVAKLADGNYWLIENLRLNNTPELTALNTNNPSLPLTNNYSSSTTSNYLSATANSWCTGNNASCDDQSMLNTTNTTWNAGGTYSPSQTQSVTSSNAHTSLDNYIYSYGNYYNWYSATAGNGKYSVSSGNTTGDLCPTGWHIPYGNDGTSTGGGNTSGGFSYLDRQLGGSGASQSTVAASNRWRTYPNNFIYSGYWYGSSVTDRGTEGYYWSITASNNANAYYLSFSNSQVYPGVYRFVLGYGKHRGRSVRCVLNTN